MDQAGPRPLPHCEKLGKKPICEIFDGPELPLMVIMGSRGHGNIIDIDQNTFRFYKIILY